MENKAYTTYTWHTATGDVTEEISEYWAGILADLDRGDYNNDHKQFRDARRCGTEIGEMEDKMIEDSFNLEESVILFDSIMFESVISFDSIFGSIVFWINSVSLEVSCEKSIELEE